MYNVIVCDDNTLLTDALVAILSQYAELYDINVVGFYDGYKALEYCLCNKFDIIYMDIEIGEMNGMSLAKRLKAINSNVLIIYISGYDCYYVEMVQAEPFRFILKDRCDWEKELTSTLDAAIQRINGNDLWSFKFNGNKYSVELKKITHFQSCARTIHIGGNIGEPSYFYGKLDELEQALGKISPNFIRISKSCIVNINYCYGVIGKKNQVKVGDEIFPVTRKYRATVFEKIRGCVF